MVVEFDIRPKLVRVTLAIYGEQLDPAEITQLLKLKPTRCHRKGEAITTAPATRSHKVSTGAWLLTSENHVNNAVFEEHLSWLLNVLSEKQQALEQVQKLGCNVQVRCGWHAASSNTVPELSVDVMSRLVQLNLPILFDIYFSGPSLEEEMIKALTS
jgi:hypothetical protein